ncbi:MAG: Spo0B domain-containing protein [Bacillota bacterium]|nr:Spo0B domain-containing protein [Bacillota bacterium]
MDYNSKKAWIVILILTHVFIAITLVLAVNIESSLGYDLEINFNKIATHLLIASAILAIISLKIVWEIVGLLEVEAKSKLQQERMEQMEQFNLTLREQRHDFLNHLQVVSGFIQIKKNDKAKEYLLNLSENLMVSSEQEHTLDTEVGMLIYTKKAKANQHQINWIQRIDIDLSTTVVPKFDLVRILANVIDNAIYELKQVPIQERKIVFIAEERQKKAVISIVNYGTIIDEQIINLIFNPGFTTKKGKGDGMGLFIVKTLVEKWGGTVNVIGSSSENLTRVIITLPLAHPHLLDASYGTNAG